MYNLLVGFTDGTAWGSRMLTHTSDEVRDRFTTVSGTVTNLKVEELQKLPALIMPEVGDSSPQFARVGQVTQLVKSGKDYSFTFVENTAFDPIPLNRILLSATRLGIGDWELGNSHWAVKDVDLYRVLAEDARSTTPKPTVFRFPTDEGFEADLVAVMMPFEPGFDQVYEALKDGVAAAGMRCLRADDIWEKHHILDDVISLIWRARVVLADLSGKNPNVFYETGIAHSLGRDTLLIAQSMDDVPFDLRQIRVLTYLNNSEGRQVLSGHVTQRLRTITS